MMQIADLYVRVSTDEQAEKGYSLRAQQEVLVKYCELNRIQVREIFVEDCSAKTFNRPEWKRLMGHLKRHKGKSNLLLFTKWDRFSRNTSDAYQMIAALKKLEVEPQAIEQPLNLDVPENKMMLAIYLTTPEIENDRRGLNTKAGIRQARKEGRWTNKAPKGYINRTAEDGRKYIVMIEPEASIIKWVFETLAEGFYSAEHVLKAAWSKGLKCSKNNFLVLIRNPMYYGKIRLEKFGIEEARLVNGLHQPLISESLFYKVQSVLEGRKKTGTYGAAIATPEDLPLRNFLKCPKCNRMLTGSASKGRSSYRVYYHCTSKCGVRYRADEVNNKFVETLMGFIPRQGYDEIFAQVITDAYHNQTKLMRDERADMMSQIRDYNHKMDNARELMLSNDIEPSEYRQIKEQSMEKITRLEADLNELKTKSLEVFDIHTIAVKSIRNLDKIDEFYERADIQAKRYLVGILFPMGLEYKNEQHRTANLNKAAELIYLINNDLRAKKMGQKSDFKTLPHKG